MHRRILRPLFLQTDLKSANFFKLTVGPWILVPDARKTLIWHLDFLFFWGRAPQTPAPGLSPPFQNSWICPCYG